MLMWIVTDVAPYRDGPAGVHGVLPQARTALAELAALAGLDARPLDSVAELDATAVQEGGVLALFTIGETRFTGEQRAAIAGTWMAGKLAVLGVHAATDACHAWDEYGTILGARFDGHPWTQPIDLEVADPTHPATSHLAGTWPWHDEVYMFKDLRPDARILLRAGSNQLDLSVPGARQPAWGFPMAWCLEDGGRTFYTSLGHFPSAWENPVYLRHLAGGLGWLLSGTSPTIVPEPPGHAT